MAVALAGTTLLGAGLWHKHHRISPAPSKQVTKNADALPTGVSEATLADIRSSLEKQEYHISYDEQKKKLQSPNRRNNIRAYYEPGKLTVQTRVDTTGQGFKVELVNDGVFADGKLLYTPQVNAKATHHENKVQISHEAFTEEFINNEDGVRQNFIVQTAPTGTRQLQVKMTAKGLEVEQGSGNELRFYSKAADGQTRNELVYSDLKCWDANKKPLNANLAYVDNHIQISVDVAGANYPVTIDPIITNGTPQNANKVLEINQSYMWLGFSVSSAGDVNGDGYSDVVVGAPHYDLGEDNEGGAFVYKGGAFVLTATAVTFQSNQAGAEMGYSVSTAGDFNGDGFSDVLVGIPYYDQDAVDDGSAKLYLGSSTFFDPQATITSYNFGNGHAGAFMGISVATAGDIDGDGFSDVLIGAREDSKGQTKEGTVAVCYGSANGDMFSDLTYLQIDQANAMFGYSVASAGDIDADGYSDVIVGARWYKNGQGQDGEGAAFIYKGSGNGLQSSPSIIESNQLNAAMGNKVSSAGDVNGDGYSDVLISACLYDVQGVQDNGIVQLYLGSSTGIGSQPQPARTFYGKYNDHMGSSVACAGDVNGDGYSDILLGAEYYDNGQFNEGAVYVYLGSKDGIFGEPVATMESNQVDGWFGTAVASAGDVNGDGYSDLLISAYLEDGLFKDEGQVRLYFGSSTGINQQQYKIFSGRHQNDHMGSSISCAGDLNGDGFDDVIVGIPLYDNGSANEGRVSIYYGSQSGISNLNETTFLGTQHEGQLGASVSSAGDINKDGYSDIVVGESGYDLSEWEYSDEGRVWVYYGSANGVIPNGTVLNGQLDNLYFGYSVSGTDINNDSYTDVLVGCTVFGDGEYYEGAVYVYYGSQTGVVPINPTILQSNVAWAQMGNKIATGDINSDGFNDIVVGATTYSNSESNEGAIFIYYGTDKGPNVIPAIVESNIAEGYFGRVSSAGDVNGDGYSDLIVGECGYSSDQANEGAFYLFLGSANGLVSSYNILLQSNQTSAFLGNDVAGAGDINGDGFSDIIVSAHRYDNGQSNEGKAFVYYGNSSLGTRNSLRLYNSADLTTPINHTQFAQNNFGAGLFAKSFTGRNKGKLIWETKPLAQGFSKGSNNRITNSVQSTGSQNVYADLGTTGLELKNVIDKQGPGTKVRVRVKYDPVLALTGQSYGPWRYLPAYLMGNSTAPVPEEEGNDLSETIEKKASHLDEGKASELATIYPNPVSSRLNIDFKDRDRFQSLRILTASGSVAFQSNELRSSLDVSKFPEGAYFLIITKTDGSLTTRQIMIRR